jgi:polyisoprenoid-binding protein YceI
MQLYRLTAMFIGLLLALLLDPIWASENQFLSNIDHSNISFKVKFLEISEVQGSFEKFKTQFSFDPDSNQISNIKLSISTNSINTGNKKRDLHLRRKDFFNVKKFPDMYFESKEKVDVEKSRSVKGTLFAMGKQVPMSFSIKYLGKKKDTWEKLNHFFEFAGTISRKDLGLNWNKTLEAGGFVVGDKVQVFGTIQAQKLGQKTVFSRFLIPDSETIRSREKISRGEAPAKVTTVEVKATNIVSQPADLKIIDSKKSEITTQPKKMNLVQGLSSIQLAGYVIVGFYGFIGAISLALLVQYSNRKEEIEESGYKKFFKESMFDSLSIIVIVPYALAMWTYMFF